MVCFGANILRVHPNIALEALLCTNLIPTHLSVDIDNTCPCTHTELSNSTCSVVIWLLQGITQRNRRGITHRSQREDCVLLCGGCISRAIHQNLLIGRPFCGMEPVSVM